MNAQQRTIEIAFLIPDQSWIGTVISPAEIFQGMAINDVVFQNSQYRGIETCFIRCSWNKVSGFSGLPIETVYLGDSRAQHKTFDAVIVPSVWDLSADNLTRTPQALDWLRSQHAGGAIVAGLVTGVFFLAEAGLLNEREATIHWASVNLFRQRYPRVSVSPQLQMVEADNIITTSSTPATFDVVLMLIQRFLGDRSAEFASHYFRIRDKDAPLPRFLEPSSNDTLVDAARDVMRLHYAEPLSLAGLADQLNVTPRTLTRRFVQATGLSPIQYLTRQRLNAGRRLLQSTDLQIQQIAEQCGFASSTVFCRNFKQAFKETPRECRRAIPGPTRDSR